MKFLAPVCQVQPAARRKLTQSHDWKEVTAGCIYGARNTKRIFIIFACLSLRLFCVYNVVQQCCRSFFGSRDPLSTRLQSPCICDAPRIISIWHSVDNSWSLFIYKSFVDFLSNRTGKKKGKRFFVTAIIFLLKNYSKRRWIRIESTYLRTTVRGHPVLDLWFI